MTRTITYLPERLQGYEDEAGVRVVYSLCHPLDEMKPVGWYFVHPTLVVKIHERVIAFTSFSVNLNSGGGLTMYGDDVCVHPDYRGCGLGEILHTARLAIGFSVGARIFIGAAYPSNLPMIRILEKSGMHKCLTVEGKYMFVGPIEKV